MLEVNRVFMWLLSGLEIEADSPLDRLPSPPDPGWEGIGSNEREMGTSQYALWHLSVAFRGPFGLLSGSFQLAFKRDGGAFPLAGAQGG